MDKRTGEFSKSDLESLTRFVAVGKGIISLKGLDSATNLTLLRLDNNSNDLKPIADLIKLEGPNVNGNIVDDLKPISNLINLTTLSFDRNEIFHISSLNKLKRIESITGHFNAISDISVIKN